MKTLLVGNLKSKLAWLGTMLMVLGVLQDQWDVVSQFLPQGSAGKAMGLLGIVIVILRNLTTQSIEEKAEGPTPTSGKQGGFARPFVLLGVSALASGALLLSSCANTPGTDNFERGQILFHLATDVAVMKFVENSNVDRREARKANIKSVAQAVKSFAAGEEVTIGLLREQVNKQLDKLNLSSTDRLLANELVNLLAAELAARVSPNILNEKQRFQVSQVMDWIITAVDAVPVAH